MITLDAALALLADAVTPLAREEVAIHAAAGRVLAAPVIARTAFPRSAVAAMDGYAVSAATTVPDAPLRLIGESRAGARFAGCVGAGEAVRIFTGAPMPDGADRCIMQEYATRDGDLVRFAPGYGPGWHVREAGSDFAAENELLAAGTRLGPRAMVAAAAADRAMLSVHARPRVAILGTGDELAPPGSAWQRSDAIPDSVTHGITAMVEEAGGEVVTRSTGGDDLNMLEALAATLLAAADVVVVTGGASVGERDFARPMFAPHGLDLLFAKVAIKPGKPVWIGRARGTWVVGLPGNPGSAMVTARLFLLPLLAALQGQAVAQLLRWRHLPLVAPLGATGSRETLVRACWDDAGLRPIAMQDSGAQHALVEAGWLIRCPAGQPALPCGQAVAALSFTPDA
ncbi:molybdopterin molybdotransferase MoeA [Sphingomonas sp.]|uniref:molybdopterin molybdotransferase MoeA n=1 Tax=Sphingomonas sp. TaxID=28214 RepID=UPI0017E75524|nr:molybdopterin molybdotransferase MoeA [Sphingomonas sp.]MBA4760283.1 molybdopterin molybdotransferase MoeA [Sphingomonas sp.]